MLIETSRFLLRDFTEADRAAFIAYQMDPRYLRLYDLGEDHAFAASALFDRIAGWQREVPRANVQLGIYARASGRICGCAGLRRAGQADGEAALGIELTPDDWGRYRLAVEVVSALIDYGFGTLGLTRIIGKTASGNRRAGKLARWFGAEIAARRDGGPEWMKARGWQEVDWALTRESWAASAGKRRTSPG